MTLLLVTAVAMVLLLCMSLVSGLGRSVSWYPDPEMTEEYEVERLPSVLVAAPVIPLQSYSAAWLDPLFHSTRKPLALLSESHADKPVTYHEALSLTGVVLTSELRLALFKLADGESLAVREGQYMPNGLLLEEVGSHEVYLKSGDTKQRITLSVVKLPSEN